MKPVLLMALFVAIGCSSPKQADSHLPSYLVVVLEDMTLSGVDVMAKANHARVVAEFEKGMGRSMAKYKFTWSLVDRTDLEPGQKWAMADLYMLDGTHLGGAGDIIQASRRSEYWGIQMTLDGKGSIVWRDTLENAADAVALEAFELFKGSSRRLGSMPSLRDQGISKSAGQIEFEYRTDGKKTKFLVVRKANRAIFAEYDLSASSTSLVGAKKLVDTPSALSD